MNASLLLAQQASQSASSSSDASMWYPIVTRLDILHHPNELLDRLSQVPFLAGSALVAVGLLCVFNGYRWHKWVVAILAFLAGLRLGDMLSEQFGRSEIVAIALGSLCAIVATPLMKITVAIFSGLTGAFIGANVWTAFNATAADQNWAGAAMGFIALALISLIVFRVAIVLFTSVGGAAMVVFGAIALLLHVEAWEPAVRSSMASHQLMIPVLVLLAAVGSFVLQEGRLREESKSQGSE